MASLGSFISWTNVIGAVAVYWGTLAFYRLLLHPLARFPGPKLAAITRWYEGYYDLILNGQYTLKIRDLHKEYGPVIRISPHELHVSDPAFYDTIYTMVGRWDKYSFMYDAFGAPTSTLCCVDHDAHKARRAAVAPLFSKAKIVARQDIIHRNVEKLCKRVSDLVGSPFNLGAAISAFTRDIANEFVIGKEYKELDQDDFNIAFSVQSAGIGPIWRITKFFPWFNPALRSIPLDWVAKIADKGTKSFLRYLQQCEQDTRDTLAAVHAGTADATAQSGLVYAVVHSKLPPQEKTVERIHEEVATVTGAGFETTANTLRLIIFYVFTNPDILHRLRTELASVSVDPSGTIPLKSLEQLPYLTAVLTEGLRLSPAVGTRTPRVTNKELVYEKWRIPANTPVGMSVILMHTDENNYPDPMRFDPDRWLNSRERKGAEKAFAPFSRGTRVCLGMPLAWAELYLVMAALIQRFDLKIEGAKAADFEIERDNFGIGTKAGCNLLTIATPYEG